MIVLPFHTQTIIDDVLFEHFSLSVSIINLYIGNSIPEQFIPMMT